MSRILNFNKNGTKAVKNSTPEIRNKRMLARGSFCAVYEASPETVWKLTMDKYAYDFHAAGAGFESSHFVKVIIDRGIVGYQDGHPLFLYLTERLNSVYKSSPAFSKARTLRKDFLERYVGTGELHQARRCYHHDVALAMSENRRYSASIRHALEHLAQYIYENPGVHLDLGQFGNYMSSVDDGRLILMDPLYNEPLIEECL